MSKLKLHELGITYLGGLATVTADEIHLPLWIPYTVGILTILYTGGKLVQLVINIWCRWPPAKSKAEEPGKDKMD